MDNYTLRQARGCKEFPYAGDLDRAYTAESRFRASTRERKKKAGATTFIRLVAPAISNRASDFQGPVLLTCQRRA